jgi:hypothetical protein
MSKRARKYGYRSNSAAGVRFVDDPAAVQRSTTVETTTKTEEVEDEVIGPVIESPDETSVNDFLQPEEHEDATITEDSAPSTRSDVEEEEESDDSSVEQEGTDAAVDGESSEEASDSVTDFMNSGFSTFIAEADSTGEPGSSEAESDARQF